MEANENILVRIGYDSALSFTITVNLKVPFTFEVDLGVSPMSLTRIEVLGDWEVDFVGLIDVGTCVRFKWRQSVSTAVETTPVSHPS